MLRGRKVGRRQVRQALVELWFMTVNVYHTRAITSFIHATE